MGEIDDKNPKLRTEDEKNILKSLRNKIRYFPKNIIDGIQKKFPRLQRTPKTAEQRKEQVWGALRANSKFGLCYTPWYVVCGMWYVRCMWYVRGMWYGKVYGIGPTWSWPVMLPRFLPRVSEYLSI